MAAAGLRMGWKVACVWGEGLTSYGKSPVVTLARLPIVKCDACFRHVWRTYSSTVTEEPRKDGTSQPPITETETDSKLKAEVENLSKQVVQLVEQNKELNDKYKRSLADGENLRKRMLKQIEDAKLFGIQSFCKDLIEVADILAKATESIPKDEIKDSNPHLKNLFEGLKMTEAQLHKVFNRHGLEQVNPLNEKFDPNFHDALFQQEVEGKAAGTVVVVSKVGYKLHDRVVRPAVVGVAKGS